MKAGQLKHIVKILAPSPSRDAYGSNQQTWAPILTTRASIQQLRGALLTLAQARTSTAIATHVITIRFNPKVRETHRVQFGNDPNNICSVDPVVYSITSIIDPDTSHREMKLLCVTVKA